jgi:hypothetical protein
VAPGGEGGKTAVAVAAEEVEDLLVELVIIVAIVEVGIVVVPAVVEVVVIVVVVPALELVVTVMLSLRTPYVVTTLPPAVVGPVVYVAEVLATLAPWKEQATVP